MLGGPSGTVCYWKSRWDSKEFPGIVLHLGDLTHPSDKLALREPYGKGLEYTRTLQAVPCKSSKEADHGPQSTCHRKGLYSKKSTNTWSDWVILGWEQYPEKREPALWPTAHLSLLLPSSPGLQLATEGTLDQHIRVWSLILSTPWLCDLRQVPFPFQACSLICELELTMLDGSTCGTD